MESKKQQERIIAGVDFGTTFSGVAETYSGRPAKPDEINVVKTWPGGSNLTSEKVPSEISYNKVKKGSAVAESNASNAAWSTLMGGPKAKKSAASVKTSSTRTTSEVTTKWGFEIKPEETRLRCMKLLLDHKEMPAFVSNSEIQELLAACGKTATVVVADYLRGIYQHARAELLKRYGADFLDSTDIQWILTVPAVWSDGAKNATLTAAKKAGMGPELTLISEPEAPAVYTLQAMPLNFLKEGDNFVVVDAGGGTVDLISYEIKQIRPLRIEESVAGSGACCGAALLSVKFEEYVKSKLGKMMFNLIRRKQPRTWYTALKYFEDYVKRNFDPDDICDFAVPLPGVDDDEDVGVEQGFLTLPGQDVVVMFQQIITDITDLVQGQLNKLRQDRKKVAGIILVGGFGNSRCLFKVLTHRFGKQEPSGPRRRGFGSSHGLEIMQPRNAWTAVVRGAVLRGLEGVDLVSTRKSRRHYGINTRTKFYPTIHPMDCKFWSDEDSEFQANNRMEWYIGKGSTVSSTVPLVFPFYRTFEDGASKTVVEQLVVCDNDGAPAGYSTSTGSMTRVLCKMPVNLNAVPTRLWKSGVSFSGRPHTRLDYEIGMQIESGGLRFELRVDGVVYANVTAEFD